MEINVGSIHHQILDRLCCMPKAVRGISSAMLQRHFGNLDAVEDLASAGLIRRRGWADGPGAVYIPTAEGEALHQEMNAPQQSPLMTQSDRLILPQRSN